MDRLTHRTRPIADREHQAAAETIEHSLTMFDMFAAKTREQIAAGEFPHMEIAWGSRQTLGPDGRMISARDGSFTFLVQINGGAPDTGPV